MRGTSIEAGGAVEEAEEAVVDEDMEDAPPVISSPTSSSDMEMPPLPPRKNSGPRPKLIQAEHGSGPI